ncbi:MAG: hypothetical protein HKP59_08090 [Lutibacter sp.]|uniref:hypothetical protein n=1 Tax=Lutibacter sp. TaxID=1925666 RepID=UPI0017B559F3|nr:hypothetical protein [Lutibacter sp.]MBT8317572.1 hypothetical protein [Lutibacter sp.]NNJ58431.1 hypothetical protein [Lutibacter sp.]
MKNYILLLFTVFLTVSCSGQNNEAKNSDITKNEKNIGKEPNGSWKVNKEFDENGNLISYDSMYSWSSSNKLENLSSVERDSLMQLLKSRFFTNFSGFKNQGFDDVFSQDSVFSERFFNDDFFGSDFGKDFMDIDKIREQMIARQKKFLEKYQSEFVDPKGENKNK